MDFSLKKFSKEIFRAIQSFSLRERIIFVCALIALIVSCSFLFILFSNSGTTKLPLSGGKIHDGVIGAPRFINPLLAQTESELDLTTLVYSGLMRKVDEGVYIPDLAESYSISSDGKEYTFVLRKDLIFHDNVRLTADDVIYTVTQAQDPTLKSPRSVNWQGVRVEKIDTHTVVFKLSQPFAGFLDAVILGIMPEHIWNYTDSASMVYDTHNVRPVGSGPYSVRSIIEHNDGTPKEYKLKRFKKFALGVPYIRIINITFFNSFKEQYDAFRAHEISSMTFLSHEHVLEKKMPRYKNTVPLNRNFGLFFNTTASKNPLLTQKGVQVLEILLNKEQLINDVLGGYGTVLQGALPPSLKSYSYTPYTDEQAVELIQKLGWTYNPSRDTLATSSDTTASPLKITLSTGNAKHLIATAEHIRDQLSRAGIIVDVVPYDSETLANSVLAKRNFEVLLFGQGFQHDTSLFAFWHSSQRLYPGLNITQYVNKVTDNLLDKARVINDFTSRLSRYQSLDATLVTDRPALFLYAPMVITISSRFENRVIPKSYSKPSDRWNLVYQWYVRTHRVWNAFLK